MIRLAYTPNPLEPWRHRTATARPHQSLDAAIHEAFPDAPALDDLSVVVNGKRASSPRGRFVAPGDVVQVARAPRGPHVVWGWAAIAEIGALQATISFALFAFFATEILRRLMPSLPEIVDPADDDPSYSFHGITASRTEGRPIGVIHGEYRSGGQLINEFIENQGGSSGDSTYATQISFGEGPVYAIGGVTTDTPPNEPRSTDGFFDELPGGILIEGNAAENLPDVEAHVRLGTSEQTAELGYQFLETRNDVGTALTQVESDSSNINVYDEALITLADSFADQDAAFDEYGVTFDLTTDSFDAVRITFRFPRGYGKQGVDTDRALAFWHMARFQELDAANNPITTGGDHGDGWVRWPARRNAFLSESPFSVDVIYPMYEPDGWDGVTMGWSLEHFGNLADNCRVVSPEVPATWDTPGDAIDSFTFECWFENDVDADSTFPLLRCYDPGAGGIEVTVTDRTYNVFPGEQATYKVPRVRFWATGFEPNVFFEGVDLDNDSQGIGAPTFVIQEGERYHLAVTYKAGVQGSSWDRLRLYGNGELIQEWVRDINFRAPDWSANGGLHIGSEIGIENALNGRIDELWILHSERGAAAIADDYNHGVGRRGQAGQLGTNLVMGFHFDGNSNGFQNDYTNDAVTSGATNTAGVGWITQGWSNETPHAGKWRVQVMRDNYESTADALMTDAELEAVTGIVDEAFSYPGEARLSLKIGASEQLASAIPRVTALVKGRECPIWNGLDPNFPTFMYAWTQNPAWICLDIILSRRYGLGQIFDATDVDLQSVQDFADFCDEIVTDHLGDYKQNQLTPDSDIDGWLNINYDETTVDDLTGVQRGSLLIAFGTDGAVPTHWKVGEAVRFTGLPDPTSHPGVVLLDVNYPNMDGFEIKSINRGGGGTSEVTVYYDRLDQGAPWTGGGSLDTAINPDNPYGTIEGAEKRFKYDADSRTASPAWEKLVEVAGTARAVPLLEGSRVRFRLNRARTPVSFVGIGNIVEGSFEVQYANSAPINAYTIEFADEDLDYDRSTAYDEHPSIQNAASLDEVRTGTLSLRGVTRRSQAIRHARALLNANVSLLRAGRWKASVDQIHFEVGDLVWLSHELMDWGLGGRLSDDSDSGNDWVKLDREITVAIGTTYYIRVRNSQTGDFETAQVDVPSTSGTTYAIGDQVPLMTALTFTPETGAPYLFYESGDEFTADITSITLAKDLTVEVEWVEYDATVYDDDFGSLTTQPPANNQPAMMQDFVIPDSPTQVVAVERAVRGVHGTETPRVIVSWSPDVTARSRTSGYAIWWKVDDVNSGLFKRAASVGGDEVRAEISIDGVVAGDVVVVAVQPISHGGARRPADRCAQARVTISGIGPYPVGPTSFAATMHGGEVTYSWMIRAGEEHLFHEIRRGGWLLGQVVGVAPPGASELVTTNWASGPTNDAGISDPTLYLRSRTASGRYSAAAQELVFTPAPVKYVTHEGLSAAAEAFYSQQSWEDYGTGWVGGAYGATLTDLAVNADGELIFASGGALVGYYESAVPSAAMMEGMRIDPVFVEAHAVGYQIHPIAWEGLPWTWGDPLMRRMSWEGPIDQGIDGETSPCSLVIEIAVKPDKDAAWTSWQRYAPGVYEGVGFKYRLVVTRPTTSYDVRISRFATRSRRVPAGRWERAPGVRFGYAELYR